MSRVGRKLLIVIVTKPQSLSHKFLNFIIHEISKYSFSLHAGLDFTEQRFSAFATKNTTNTTVPCRGRHGNTTVMFAPPKMFWRGLDSCVPRIISLRAHVYILSHSTILLY
ncbi:Uncharacterized protein FWK35_00033999 [Aphis craccivora]|uniref:Uncharacterized protein n=1 Tax=Aphis craccivora TaxID=307492 RepID=A0A6G0YCJ9_APHCR|nr:Uncharacterized protein FWK35_00033999 [Aphis craccivora]